MAKLLLVVVLFVTNLLSSEFYLNPYYKKQVQKNSKSYNILKDYVRFLNTLEKYDEKKKIIKVNNYLNGLVSKYDAYNYNSEEHWATPFEFLSKGGGDCEDYVIAKKYTLEKVGISSKDLYLGVVKEKLIGGDHMVLNLHVDKSKPPVVLDNLSFKVLPSDKRTDLDFIFIFNETGFFKLENKTTLVKTDNIKLPQYKKMQQKSKEELVLQR